MAFYQSEFASYAVKNLFTVVDSSRLAEKKEELRNKIRMGLALFLWMGFFHLGMVLLIASLLYLPHPAAVLTLVFLITLISIPVNENSEWGKQLAAFICSIVPSYFPLQVVFEGKEMLSNDKPYIFVYEPHSVLPVGTVAFGHGSNMVPLKNVRTLGSSALDWAPFCRHLWKWMGLSAVSRSTFSRLLSQNISCVVIPGGVQECLHMNSRQEVLYLRNRKGFIKLAFENGVPLVPVFCFGQRDVLRMWFPRYKWFHKLSRKLKFIPMPFWGAFGLPIPSPKAMFLVIGKPIPVPQAHNPTEEQISAIQKAFIESMVSMYEKHKAMAGAKDIELVIL